MEYSQEVRIRNSVLFVTVSLTAVDNRVFIVCTTELGKFRYFVGETSVVGRALIASGFQIYS